MTINNYYFDEVKGKKAVMLSTTYTHYMRNELGYGLYAIYKNFSSSKLSAYKHCENLRHSLNGYKVKLCGNTCTFTYAFIFEDKETGVLKLVYITRNHNYICDYNI